MRGGSWRNQIKMETAVDLYRMYPGSTVSAISRSIRRGRTTVYRYFNEHRIRRRPGATHWAKLRRGVYVSPCGRFRAERRGYERWTLLRVGRAVEVFETLRSATQGARGY